jgi:signal transduction histidine kinase
MCGFFVYTTMRNLNIQDPYAKPIKVLAVEDTQVDRKILDSMLKESKEKVSFVQLADTLKSSLKYLKEYEFDVIILDLNLPDSQGLDTLKVFVEKVPHIAIVVNTGAYEDDLGVETLSHGAQDFLVKGKYNAYVLNKVMRYSLERKRLELGLREAYAKLKDTQSQLIQAEKLKVVGSLASGVAHEVKNPLATILYGVTYLDENVKSNDKNYQTVLENIKEAANRANDIITDLLDFSTISRLKKTQENINDLVQKALSLIGHQLEKNIVTVKFDLDKKLPSVEIDRNRIEQVFVNLLLNAVFAMPNGGEITISSYKDIFGKKILKKVGVASTKFEENEPIVVFEIRDTGCGIEEEQVSKVFDPFFTTRRAKGGIGLGLSVCKNIIDNHNGEIFLINHEEGGAQAILLFKL